MARKKKILSPTYTDLIIPTYEALVELGGSGTNSEICDKVIQMMDLSDEIVDEHHIKEAPQDCQAADRDVQESGIRPEWVIITEYGVIWRREIFLPLLMIGY